MKLADFEKGLVFYTGSGDWLCTDVGSRVITAIKLDGKKPEEFGPAPYAVDEIVFDEYDQGGCYRTRKERP